MPDIWPVGCDKLVTLAEATLGRRPTAAYKLLQINCLLAERENSYRQKGDACLRKAPVPLRFNPTRIAEKKCCRADNVSETSFVQRSINLFENMGSSDKGRAGLGQTDCRTGWIERRCGPRSRFRALFRGIRARSCASATGLARRQYFLRAFRIPDWWNHSRPGE